MVATLATADTSVVSSPVTWQESNPFWLSFNPLLLILDTEPIECPSNLFG